MTDDGRCDRTIAETQAWMTGDRLSTRMEVVILLRTHAVMPRNRPLLIRGNK